jgi:hypothetical protein
LTTYDAIQLARFLAFADWLDEQALVDAELPVEEAALRSAISRAYYAAFHVAKAFVDLLVEQGILQWPGTRRSIHDQVWDVLTLHPDPVVAGLADRGRLLKRERTEADYSVAPNKRRATIARESRRLAREIIEGIDARISSGP